MRLLIFTAILFSFAMPAQAMIREKDIKDKCEQNDWPQPPTPGVQYDGKLASEKIMKMRGGGRIKGVKIQIIRNKAFLAEFPKDFDEIEGSVESYWGRKNIVAGCSREQLSEILRKNGIIE